MTYSATIVKMKKKGAICSVQVGEIETKLKFPHSALAPHGLNTEGAQFDWTANKEGFISASDIKPKAVLALA